MPRGYRSIILAVVGWLILAAANQPAPSEQAQAQQSIANSLGNIAAMYHQEIERAQRPSKETEPCERGDDRRYSDLCAQWKAADAAADSAWWAWASGVAAIVSTAAVLFAIGLTYQANAIARDTASRQLRAYVSFAEFGRDTLQRDGETFWELQAVWSNAGATPALQLITNVNWDSFEDAPPADFDYPPNGSPEQNHPTSLGPNCKIVSRMPLIGDQIIRDVRQGKRRLFIWSKSTYCDIFKGKRRRRTWFCYEMKIESADGQMGIAFIPFGPHNHMT